MRKLLYLVVFLFCCVVPTRGQEVRRSPLPVRAWHLAGHHKRLVLADAAIIVVNALDARSSIYCQSHNPNCVETNWLLPAHPSPLQTWGVAASNAGILMAVNHLIWHFAPNDGDRNVIFFIDAPILISQPFNIESNYNIAHLPKPTPKN